MIKLLEDGRIRALGVSNFKPAHLDRLIEATGVAPHLNQIQVNPYVPRAPEREYHSAHEIVTEGYSPLGGNRGELPKEPVIADIAQRHGTNAGQIVLRWHVQQGVIPIPKSSNADHLGANLDVFGFELSAEDMAALSALDRNGAGANDSDRTGH
jgi:2,5-diketo-D-gluconate reductase A